MSQYNQEIKLGFALTAMVVILIAAFSFIPITAVRKIKDSNQKPALTTMQVKQKNYEACLNQADAGYAEKCKNYLK